MRITAFALAALLAASAALPAFASERDAKTCLRTQTWDMYPEGWSVRVMKTFSLPDASRDYKTFKINMLPGNEYLIHACADDTVSSLAVALYDEAASSSDGQPEPLAYQVVDGREPKVSFKPEKAGTYIVAVKRMGAADADANSGVSAAVSYR